jgi:hypothetical protein
MQLELQTPTHSYIISARASASSIYYTPNMQLELQTPTHSYIISARASASSVRQRVRTIISMRVKDSHIEV